MPARFDHPLPNINQLAPDNRDPHYSYLQKCTCESEISSPCCMSIMVYYTLVQNSKHSEVTPPYFRKVQLPRTTHGHIGAFNMQHSIWGNIECLHDAEVLKEKHLMYNKYNI